MQKCNIKFDDYVNMVRSRAHYYSKCYGMDYADVEAQGFLIYCETLQDYNPLVALFSTYLHRRLSGRLNDYCKKIRKIECHNESLDVKLSNEISTTYQDLLCKSFNSFELEQLLLCARDCLSDDAYQLLSWAVQRQWENKKTVSNKKITIRDAYRVFSVFFNWSLARVNFAWEEISMFCKSDFFADSNRVSI